jgi:hypothetical protein
MMKVSSGCRRAPCGDIAPPVVLAQQLLLQRRQREPAVELRVPVTTRAMFDLL